MSPYVPYVYPWLHSLVVSLILSFIKGDKVALRRAQLLSAATVQHPLPRGHALQRLNPRGDHHIGGKLHCFKKALAFPSIHRNPNLSKFTRTGCTLPTVPALK